jgi:SAM-dependent methyltransferase
MNRTANDTYGERIAEMYDRLHPGVLDTDDCVRTIAEMVGTGRMLELGVGTGRLAIPLAAAGVDVDGIDISSAMLERLNAKPGGERVRTILADFAQLDVDGQYDLVVAAADTFFMLETQDDQLRCFESVARHLTRTGSFAIEAFVPGRGQATNGGVAVRKVGVDHVVLGLSIHDPHNQLVHGQQVMIDDRGIRLAPATLRYAWPSELDLMARLTGLRLQHRWATWSKTPYTAQSLRHVSVYRC